MPHSSSSSARGLLRCLVSIRAACSSVASAMRLAPAVMRARTRRSRHRHRRRPPPLRATTPGADDRLANAPRLAATATATAPSHSTYTVEDGVHRATARTRAKTMTIHRRRRRRRPLTHRPTVTTRAILQQIPTVTMAGRALNGHLAALAPTAQIAAPAWSCRLHRLPSRHHRPPCLLHRLHSRLGHRSRHRRRSLHARLRVHSVRSATPEVARALARR